MAQVNNSSSIPTNADLRHADNRAEAKTTTPPTPQKGLDIECCGQALDPSHSLAVSHLGDCNLECSYCAVRWTTRRVQHFQDA
jgi:hypothetical protein